MKYLRGNITDAKHGIICNQLSCKLSDETGLYTEIIKKYPIVKQELSALQSKIPIEKRLGRCQIVEVVEKTLYIANLFSKFSSIDELDYGALSVAILRLKEWHLQNCHPNFPVFIPYNLGNKTTPIEWKIVEEIIENHMADALIIKQKG